MLVFGKIDERYLESGLEQALWSANGLHARLWAFLHSPWCYRPFWSVEGAKWGSDLLLAVWAMGGELPGLR